MHVCIHVFLALGFRALKVLRCILSNNTAITMCPTQVEVWSPTQASIETPPRKRVTSGTQHLPKPNVEWKVFT